MAFLTSYGLFVAKLATVILLLVLLFGLLFAIIYYGKTRGGNRGRLDVRKLNERYQEYQNTVFSVIKPKADFKRLIKSQKKTSSSNASKRIFVLNFQGDIRASSVSALREEITAILMVADKTDEVLIRLESAGGLVNAYGLAASQLQRLKEKKIPLTVSIDKMAASGGYMMACVADRILAAPFAIVGSIGVVAQLPNFHRYLQKKSIDFEQLTAGEYKRTLTVFGENTEKDRAKMQEDIDETHALFKTFIKDQRQQIDIDRVATGEHWYGVQAIHFQLIDELKTSDDYLLTASAQYDIIELCYRLKKPWSQRFTQGLSHLYDKVVGTGTVNSMYTS